jgi:hypothetical protein
MQYPEDVSKDQISTILTYAGFIVLSYELVKGYGGPQKLDNVLSSESPKKRS